MKLKRDEIPNKSPKQLRTLRNQLNNRIDSLDAGKKDDELKESHPLHGLDQTDCKDILVMVKRQLKALSNKS
jgi:hypothetical protein